MTTDTPTVRLITEEPGERLERIVPMAFAAAQLDAGYTKVQIIDPDTGVIIFEKSNVMTEAPQGATLRTADGGELAYRKLPR